LTTVSFSHRVSVLDSHDELIEWLGRVNLDQMANKVTLSHEAFLEVGHRRHVSYVGGLFGVSSGKSHVDLLNARLLLVLDLYSHDHGTDLSVVSPGADIQLDLRHIFVRAFFLVLRLFSSFS